MTVALWRAINLKYVRIFFPKNQSPAPQPLLLGGDTTLIENAWSYLYCLSNTAIKACFIPRRLSYHHARLAKMVEHYLIQSYYQPCKIVGIIPILQMKK